MKKNTCGNHKGCPPGLKCDTAKTKHVDCDAKSWHPYGDVYVPVVLADVKLQANVEADIKLPTPAKEIKMIKKNVSLKQCEALRHPYSDYKVKLYITGIVHKNIQYVDACTGFVRDYSVDVPFTCSDEVKIHHLVEQMKSKKSSLTAEFKFLAKDGHGADRCRDGSHTFEYFNEPIDCILKMADVFELDLYKDHDKWGRFTRITEKMDVNLWFKLVQKQEKPVCPPASYEPPHDGDGDGDEYPEPQTMLDRIKNRIDRMS
ncbi:CsxC family protein [Bacillus sp. SCS-153A]|uniref:CsxC family protein n=1 Tax=Rossellomorea sedimentorum TaxID=3115294 RepID=UPI0039060A92